MPEGFWANKGHWRGRFWTMGGKNSAGWLFPAVEDRFPLRNVHVVETRIRGIHEKSEKCHHIWNLKKNYISYRACRRQVTTLTSAFNSPSYQRQSKYQLSWQERALWWKLLVHLLRSLLSFLYIYIRLFWSREVGSPPSTVFINQGQLQTETFFKFCWDIPYSLYIINDLSDYHNWEEFVLAPTWNIHYTLSWLHL